MVSPHRIVFWALARFAVGATQEHGLCKRALEFLEDPTDYANVRIATLKVPEGNLVQLLEPLKT